MDTPTPRALAATRLAGGPIPAGSWIDGQPVGHATATIRHSPIDGQPVTAVGQGDAATVEAAVAAARAAFADGRWRDLPVERRQAVLHAFAAAIDAQADGLAVAETLDNGMPQGMCRNRNIPEAAQCLRWHADALPTYNGEALWLDGTRHATVSREPVGVAALVVPWNFPLMICGWKMAPALAVGCSVVIKPPTEASATISTLGRLAREAGLPDGVLNIVTGSGTAAGAPLVAHADVDCVSFTGSTAVGKEVMRAGAGNLKRVWLECGGKTAVIVTEACADFTTAVTEAAVAFFRHQGQICNAGSRLIVPQARHDEAVAICVGVAEGLKVGDPLEPGIDFGPVISPPAADQILAAVGQAQADGATLATGGQRLLEDSGGSYVAPTVLAGVTPQMAFAQEEVFGPVLGVLPCAGDDDAVAIANGTPYGLGACLYCDDLSRAHLLARRLRAGNVLVNQASGASLRLPFGGFGQSGFGRDKSVHAMDKFTELKATTFKFKAG